MMEGVGLNDEAYYLKYRPRPLQTSEIQRAVFLDTISIAEWLARCRQVPDATTFLPPDTFNSDGIFDQLRNGGTAEVRDPKIVGSLTKRELALLQLSDAIARQRVSTQTKADAAYTFWQFGTLVTIGLGMITTILVSISATEFGKGEELKPRLLRILAIVFPVLGTAAAAVIGFYGPQAEWAQASRTLASLGQLQGQIVIELRKANECDSADAKDGELAKHLEDWSKRYSDIETIASAAASASGSGTQGSSGSGGTSGTPPGK
jgi:hypothetical protein